MIAVEGLFCGRDLLGNVVGEFRLANVPLPLAIDAMLLSIVFRSAKTITDRRKTRDNLRKTAVLVEMHDFWVQFAFQSKREILCLSFAREEIAVGTIIAIAIEHRDLVFRIWRFISVRSDQLMGRKKGKWTCPYIHLSSSQRAWLAMWINDLFVALKIFSIISFSIYFKLKIFVILDSKVCRGQLSFRFIEMSLRSTLDMEQKKNGWKLMSRI